VVAERAGVIRLGTRRGPRARGVIQERVDVIAVVVPMVPERAAWLRSAPA
jgi:hypothetical protein